LRGGEGVCLEVVLAGTCTVTAGKTTNMSGMVECAIVRGETPLWRCRGGRVQLLLGELCAVRIAALTVVFVSDASLETSIACKRLLDYARPKSATETVPPFRHR